METTTIGRYHIRLPYLSIVKKNNVDSSGMNKKKTHTLYIGKKYLVEGNLTQCMSLLGIPRENNELSLRCQWDHTQVMEVLGEGEEEAGRIVEEMIAENVPSLMKNSSLTDTRSTNPEQDENKKIHA